LKIKQYKSIIHNFAHSLQSYDFTHSEKVVFDILADSYCSKGISWIEFDFISETIHPIESNNSNSNQLLTNYTHWLPEFVTGQNADINILESLIIKIEIDFETHRRPDGMKHSIELKQTTKACYKVRDREVKEIFIEEIDVYGKRGMPVVLQQKYWG
jgi:hypothetical protein